MKGSNILVGNVVNNLQLRWVLQDTEEQFMKGSNIYVDNVVNNSLKQGISQNTFFLIFKSFISLLVHHALIKHTRSENMGAFAWHITVSRLNAYRYVKHPVVEPDQ